MAKQISYTPSHYQGQIRVDFMNPDFNVLVDNKGNKYFVDTQGYDYVRYIVNLKI